MKDKISQNCASIVHDQSMPAEMRARFILASAAQAGFNPLGVLEELIQQCDQVPVLEKKVAELEAKAGGGEVRPLQPEIFLRPAPDLPGSAGVVLSQSGPVVFPLGKDLGELRRGDCVLIDRQSGQVVARDGQLLDTGEVVKVEEVPGDGRGQVIIRLRDDLFTAHVSEEVERSGDLRPGVQAVYDPQRRFVHRLLKPRIDGEDLLTPLSELSGFTLDSLGAPHPIIAKILRLVRRDLLHADWRSQMRPRQRHSFLFHGPSGGGKTSTIKVIVNLIADWIEELTGEREARVCFCDVSHFYSPYLGSSEEKIVRWFQKLGALARREVTARDGRRFNLPLTVVWEEIEGLVRQRGELGGSSHLFDRLLSLILQKMDSALNELDAPIIFISTTNKKSLLDFAARRRFAEREVLFPNASAGAALAVLEKKVPPDMKVHSPDGEDPASARRALLRAVLQYLFGEEEDQVIAEAVLRDSSRRVIHRRDLVTGALLEAAVSEAIDLALDRSTEAGELLGIDAGTLIGCLSRQFEAIATSLKPHNVQDYVPHLFQEDEVHLASVTARKGSARRPAAHYTT